MSARFFKIFSAVFIAHLVALSVVWIGFSVPNPRPLATFTYEGALPAGNSGDSSEDEWQKGESSDLLTFDRSQESYLNHWIELRSLEKPLGHL